MKNLLLLVFLMLPVISSCKYFKKPTPKAVDTLTSEALPSEEEVIDSAAYYAGEVPESPAPSVQPVSNGKNRYYMIVGCFTVQANAERYVTKLREMGYTPQILSGNNKYQMIAIRSYDNYRESIKEIDEIRNAVTPNAWVYLRK
jgi:cell division protein FtsN